MPTDPKQFEQVFRGFSDLFAEVNRHDITIQEDAIPALLGAVSYCVLFPPEARSAAPTSEFALNAWRDALQDKRGQILTQDNILGLINEICPDPVQAVRVRTYIMNRLKK